MYTIQVDSDGVHIRGNWGNCGNDCGSMPSPICLPASIQSKFIDEMAMVTGWGATSSDGDLSPTLQQVEVMVMSNERCKDTYSGIIEKY